VVMIHAGIELDQCPTPDQLSLVSTLVNAGADVVVGGHPHVLQGLTRVGGDVVDYSMGNFVFYDGSGPTAATGILTVDLGPGRNESERFSPAEMDSNGSPQLLTGSAAAAAVANVQGLDPGAGRC
jgi:poly-gamma-glutamate capsule biosynthesis protein CapA/YwtB (metallophosphatase superfamily)